MRTRISVLLLLCLFTLPSCGGGGGGGGFLGKALDVTIRWAPLNRSRDILAPSAAQSIAITVPNSTQSGSDLNFTINRDLTIPTAYTQTVTSPDAAKVGTSELVAQFHAQPNAGGALVAIAQATVTVTATSASVAITTDAPPASVTSVEVTPNQTVSVGEQKDLVFTARDANQNIIALAPGSATFAVTPGMGQLDIVINKGQATVVGLAPSTPTVTATVGNVSSPPQAVTVSPPSSPGHFQAVFVWGANSPAQSVIVTVIGGNPDGTDFRFPALNRPNTGLQIQLFSPTDSLPAGLHNYTAVFYSGANGTGQNLSSAPGSGKVVVKPIPATTPTIATSANPIASVQVASGQSVSVGQQKDLSFTAQDDAGHSVAVPPGVAVLQVSSGSDKLQVASNGQAVGEAPGTATVTATVGGVTSRPQSVTITP